MRRVNFKSGLIIIIYSLILSLALGIGLYIIKGSFNNVENKTNITNAKAIIVNNAVPQKYDFLYKALYEGNHLDIKESNTTSIRSQALDSKLVVDVDEIGKVYLQTGFEDILSIILIFFFIFILASLILWLVLNKVHDKEIENIVNNLNDIDDDFDPYSVSKTFGIAYENIKGKFKQNLEDYKKLNSYLSHEQKNAIAILRTNLEIDGNKKYIKLLDNIADSIDDILTLSDLKSDEEMVKVDVSLICASICDMYKKTYKNIEFDFDEESNTTILAKERWIYRAVSNLVDNAVKYGENKKIVVSVRSKYNSVIIKVEDNGMGMDKNFIDSIFNNKYRINDLKKDGYGIGLSLVSHVCDLCNGIVVVDSEINKGSCFYLSFSEFKE
ncbi:sensor histidine kinase [Romboutsia lituseburensis]|uniref:histidine kinase n=1 Tax=Romboutsia lituseburensis DSM 797 TaxID=1121325 RepID=A0A1G9RZX5_9FIRM|nr:HAMP domain-containing sensor histidine kinase [Romboutsia lituseburensis]CEH32872.1 Sensor histidine kinase [Romboutsia lituseburensis]SDM28587.1 Signal transduction histidine kinase [Romboutsia lituseburensis DSM 797]